MLNLSAVDENKDIATKEYADTKALKTEAIKNITRSGTTFTATRCDNTTFTFTQQDNNSVTGVKGNSESSYRTGNVNLTAANVGAAPTSHASTGTTYGLGNASNYGHVKLSSVTNGTAGDSGGVAATPLAVSTVEKRIVSRGENLIVNGNGFMGDNTNFSQLTFDGSQSNGSPASFTKSVSAVTVSSDDLFPVDISKDYLCEFDVKAADPGANMYAMLLYYDVDKYGINIQMVSYIDGSTTTLARELKNGDTKVYLTDASGFQDTSYDHQRSLIIWDYTNSFGYTYPAETYSRNYYVNKWSSNSAVDKTNNVITLSSAWTGGTHAAGTPVSQNTSGSTYCYFWYHTNISTFPRVWTHVQAVCNGTKTVGSPSGYGVKFWAGTAYCKIGFLWNYQANNNQGQIWATNISVKEDVKAGSLRDTGNAKAITAQYSGSGINSTSWLAAWSGYKICAISPNNVTVGKAKQLVPETIRPTSANTGATNTAALVHYLATTSMTTGKPMFDGHILEADWDNNGGWKSQLFLPNQSVNTSNHLQWRAQNGTGGWGNWITVLDTNSTIDAATVGGHAVNSDVPANAVFTDTQSDWNATSGLAAILNKPTIPTVPSAYTSNPKMDGTASAGSSTQWAKGDHVHPVDTSRAPATHTHSGGDITSAVANATNAANADKVNNLTVQTAVPANAVFTDTKNTAGSNQSTSKLYLVGATSQTTGSNGVQTYSNANVYAESGDLRASYFNGIEIDELSGGGFEFIGSDSVLTVPDGVDYSLGSVCEANFGSSTTTFLRNDGTWATPSGGGTGRQSTYYTTCSTAAGTAAKVITISGWTLTAGDILGVRFQYANTAATPTLKVNGTTKSIYVGNSAPNSTTNPLRWNAYDMVYFQYDGTYFRYITKAPLKTCLYNNSTGTTDAVTLSVTAANFNFMRIYFKKSSGQNQCSSVDVFSPNQKYANLTVFEPDSGNSAMWFASRTVYINGTSISTYNSVGGQVSSSPSCGSGNEVAIYRVEAW